ncbi:MAG: haloacid dehalogenase [Caldilineaceae bacterium]|nr:haloacid dehalogenase [Caldilineaceae bacterium]
MTAMLSTIVEAIRDDLTTLNTLRDATLARSRTLTRSCAHSIRAIHRHAWEEADMLLAQARGEGRAMVEAIAAQPTLYHAGYTQDALKELVEAHLVNAVSRKLPLPTPKELYVTGPTYLRGMSEAATEMRRFVLDLMRRGQVREAEQYLEFMDEVYSHLVTVDFPDAVTDGLRRHTDVLRGVLERTRGDLTLAIRQDQMRDALLGFERNLDHYLGTDFAVTDPGLPIAATDDMQE